VEQRVTTMAAVSAPNGPIVQFREAVAIPTCCDAPCLYLCCVLHPAHSSTASLILLLVRLRPLCIAGKRPDATPIHTQTPHFHTCLPAFSFWIRSARLQNDPPSGVTGAPMDTNIMVWQAVIFGPDDTPWEGGTFKLVLEFTEDYPNKAPQVRFITKMFHPNIYNDGQICLDILQNQWSPIYDISAILTSIQSLLCDPNPASPANSEASRLYNENRREYNRRVREIVEQSWLDDES